MQGNDKNCRYMFMFLLNNLARKELRVMLPVLGEEISHIQLDYNACIVFFYKFS